MPTFDICKDSWIHPMEAGRFGVIYRLLAILVKTLAPALLKLLIFPMRLSSVKVVLVAAPFVVYLLRLCKILVYLLMMVEKFIRHYLMFWETPVVYFLNTEFCIGLPIP
ncbi:MAG: hypothetical protein EBV59_09525 [Synechococcaceae bacterium WB7_1C_051]|nr:hypothetical protein [Synechococcaceae bacterium WB7_1C_051]